MSYPAPAPAPSFRLGVLMPMPGPLGRLVRRRRIELGLTQKDLNERTRTHGYEFGQNNISRLESGITQRVNDVARLTALGKALEFENDRIFIMTAFGPKDLPPETAAPLPDMEFLVRTIGAGFALNDAQTELLRRFVEHVAETADARGPSPEERIAVYARELAAEPGRHPVPAH